MTKPPSTTVRRRIRRAGPPERARRTAYQRRLRAIRQVHGIRYAVQLAVLGFVVLAAVRHTQESATGAASVDALCPFGGIETMWTWVTTGRFVTKIHASNLILSGALLLSVVLVGNAFCGWICPFGTVQDALARLRRLLHLPSVNPTGRVDRVLRLGRFVVLGLVLWASASTATLWFAGWDPYLTLFSLRWLTEPDLAAMWPAWLVLGVVLGLSLLVERAWCRYLCPLGGALSVLGHLSIVRVRRSPSACTGCNLCVRPCPVGIDVAAPTPAVSTDCIGCLECVANCPKGGALEVSAAPPWQALRKRIEPPPSSTSGRLRPAGVPVAIGRPTPSAGAGDSTGRPPANPAAEATGTAIQGTTP